MPGARPVRLAAAAFVVAAALCLPSASASATTTPLIFGGEKGIPGELPSLAFIYYSSEGRGMSCSGTVVSPWYILTAAHCAKHVVAPHGGVDGFRIVTGNVDWTASGARQVLRVTLARTFRFGGRSGYGDVGLLKLSAPTNAAPIPISSREIWEAGTKAELAGWGNRHEVQPRITRVLRRAPTTVRDLDWCREHAPYVSADRRMICVGEDSNRRTGTCDGDSGGPLLMHRPGDGQMVQIGVLRGGYCEGGKPSWFTPTTAFYEWSKRIMSAGSTLQPQASARPTGINQLRPPVTVFRVEGARLELEFAVDRRGYASWSASAHERCERGYDQVARLGEGPRRRVNSRSMFRAEEDLNEEGAGQYYTRFAGKVRPNRIVAEFRAFEEPGVEERQLPNRCGTVSPRGRTLGFVARRTAGPPWQFERTAR